MRIAYVLGTRPNFVKMASVISDRSQIGQRR
jgi:UDP-N-acetylglucosamine 2-epimerase